MKTIINAENALKAIQEIQSRLPHLAQLGVDTSGLSKALAQEYGCALRRAALELLFTKTQTPPCLADYQALKVDGTVTDFKAPADRFDAYGDVIQFGPEDQLAYWGKMVVAIIKVGGKRWLVKPPVSAIDAQRSLKAD